MAEYSREETERMSREATERVNEMRARNRQSLNWENFAGSGRAVLPSSRIQQPRREPPREHTDSAASQHSAPPPCEPREKPSPRGIEKLFSSFGFLEKLNLGELLGDGDTAFIIAILLLVSREQNDPLLTLALIYIML